MVVRAYDYYESDFVIHGTTKRPAAFMLRGICSAFMDLAYGEPFPNGMNTFSCIQTKGIELGDDYGEFLVIRA